MQRQVWSVECEVSSVDGEVRGMKCRSEAECEVYVQCLEYSVGCRVYIVKCRVSTAECECKVLCLESLECRVRSARSAVLNVGCTA